MKNINLFSFLTLMIMGRVGGAGVPQKVEVPDLKTSHTQAPLPAEFKASNPPSVHLQAHSQNIATYEPVFIEMTTQDTANCSSCKYIDLSTGDLRLIIEDNKGRNQIYRPAFLKCWFGQVQPVVLGSKETIILSGGNIVTQNAGKMRLFLSDAKSNIVSNILDIQVRGPASQKETALTVEAAKNPYEYGLFIYMAGGDQLANGYRIVKDMSESGTAFSGWAKAIMACDHAQDYIDMKEKKVLRKADFDLALSTLPQNKVPSGVLDKLEENILMTVGNGGVDKNSANRALRAIQSHR